MQTHNSSLWIISQVRSTNQWWHIAMKILNLSNTENICLQVLGLAFFHQSAQLNGAGFVLTLVSTMPSPSAYMTDENMVMQLTNTYCLYSDIAAGSVHRLWVNPKVSARLSRIESCIHPICCGIPPLQAIVAINRNKPLKFESRLILERLKTCRAQV